MSEADRIFAARKRAEELESQRRREDMVSQRQKAVREWGAVLEAGLPDLVRALIAAGYPGLVEVRWSIPPGFIAQLWSLGREEAHAAFPLASVLGPPGFDGMRGKVTLFVFPDCRLFMVGWNGPRTVAAYVTDVLTDATTLDWPRSISTKGYSIGHRVEPRSLLQEAAAAVARFRETGELPAT